MSSWPTATTSRLLVAPLALVLACERPAAKEQDAPAPSASAAAPLPPPAPLPWFQGEWHGGSSQDGASAGSPVVAQLVIDAAGQVTGTSSLKLALVGAVDEDTVRLEARGEGGHGVAVLHHRDDTLRGILNYASLGAAQGARVPLTFTRRPPP